MKYSLATDRMPDVRLVGHNKYPKGWHRTSVHRSNVFLYMYDGVFEFDVEGRALTLSSGELVIFPAGTKYRVTASTDADYAYLHFSGNTPLSLVYEDGNESDEKLLLFSEKTSFNDSGEKKEKLIRRIARCENEFTSSERYAYLKLSAAFFEFLLFVASCNLEKFSPQMPHSVQRMTRYISEHPHESITLVSLSNMTGLSKQYIMRLFKTHVGMTVTHYINTSKLIYAQKLLRESDLNIEEIAYELGFCGSYYFCRLHKKYFGITPSEYRSRSYDSEM